jgi:hypothetical protein
MSRTIRIGFEWQKCLLRRSFGHKDSIELVIAENYLRTMPIVSMVFTALHNIKNSATNQEEVHHGCKL